jgi:hypothetical protein
MIAPGRFAEHYLISRQNKNALPRGRAWNFELKNRPYPRFRGLIMLAEMMICWLMFTVMISAKAAGSMISRKYELQTTYHSGGSETFGRRKGERLPNDCMRAWNDAAILRPTRLGALEFEKR